MQMTGKEVAIAILNGASPSDFEYKHKNSEVWKNVGFGWNLTDFTIQDEVFRRKIATRVINFYTVPAPITGDLYQGQRYFLPVAHYNDWCVPTVWKNDDNDKLWHSRGLIFETEEAAIANAKAMCGIDPNT